MLTLKYARLSELGIQKEAATVFAEISQSTLHGPNMQFIRLNLEDREALPKLFKTFNFDMVCNLAAQPGVRYSIENPEAYIDSNVTWLFKYFRMLPPPQCETPSICI